MTERFVCVALPLVALLAVATGSRAVRGQEPVRVTNPGATVICAPSAGETFGFSASGMVLMSRPDGNLYFYPLERAEARSVGIGIQARVITTPKRIGSIGDIGLPLVWAKPDGR